MKMSVLLLIAFTTLVASGQTVVKHPFLKTTDIELRERYWSPDRFTSPSDHDSRNFMYIVHKIDAPTGLFMLSGVSKWVSVMLKDPSTLLNKYRICTSVISDEFPSSFKGSIGFILEVPAINIGAISPTDLASTGTNDLEGNYTYFASELAKSPKFYTPLDLVLETKRRSNSWNEVLVTSIIPKTYTGLSKDSKVKVTGLILDCKHPRKGTPHSVETKMVIKSPAESEKSMLADLKLIQKCMSFYPQKTHKDFYGLVEELYKKEFPIVMFAKPQFLKDNEEVHE